MGLDFGITYLSRYIEMAQDIHKMVTIKLAPGTSFLSKMENLNLNLNLTEEEITEELAGSQET